MSYQRGFKAAEGSIYAIHDDGTRLRFKEGAAENEQIQPPLPCFYVSMLKAAAENQLAHNGRG